MPKPRQIGRGFVEAPMEDYQPVDLAPFCNAGMSFLGAAASPVIGRQTFHGLPFQIGPAAGDGMRCYLGFCGEVGVRHSITVPMGSVARRVIFAHALLQSELFQGDPIGRLVATYVFRFADGQEVAAAIRERLEIGVVPATWGQVPFLAMPDQKDRLMPRYEGRWDQVATRQFEALRGAAQAYYLWAWESPHPEQALESVTIRPADRKFLVAGITLGHADEPPFPREGARDVRISLPRAEDARAGFQMEVEVDRGVATFPFPLPERPEEAFLRDPMAGWGEGQNDKASPAHVRIAAIPSATVTVRNAGEELGKAHWGDLMASGGVQTPRVHLELMDRGKNWVHVTVLDDQTGRPVPCRVHFRSPEGIPYQPYGHHDRVNSNLETFFFDVGGDARLGQITYAYIDGKCQGWLPRGEVIVDVARGFEYEPLRTKVRIEPGQRELTLRIRRWADQNAQGWYSGDPHVHAVGLTGAHREAQGEDVNFVNLMATQLGHLFTNTEDFTGRPTTSNDGRTIVYCSQENRQHMLGHLSLLGLKEPVMPWCSGGPGEAEMGGTLEEVMSHWADACHAQGGTVIIPHIPNPNGEPAVLIATGRADAMEMVAHGAYQHLEYYRYLNGGYRLPLVGGTDKMHSSVPIGICRTYARLADGEPFTYENWSAAVRAGRTFLSCGPLLRFTAGGARIGDTLNLPGIGGAVEVEATAESIFPIHTLQIVREGRVVASTEEAGGARRLHLKASLKLGRHTWLAARCGGPDYTAIPHHDAWRRGIFAHTSPIYVAVGGEWWMFSRETAQYMLTLIGGGLDYVRHVAPHHPPGSVTHHHGQHDHLGYLERPFHEAREAVRQRLNRAGLAP